MGQRCTPFQSPGFELPPFYLENLATPGTADVFTALVSFDVAGTVTARGVTQSCFGTISTTFVGASFQAALMGREKTGLQGVPFTGRFVVGGPAAVASAAPAARGRLTRGRATACAVPDQTISARRRRSCSTTVSRSGAASSSARSVAASRS